MKHFIVYCSPNGSTRHVAETIANRLSELGEASTLFDLADPKARQDLGRRRPGVDSPACLWVGSPVYADHVTPPVERFLLSLQKSTRGCAVPFATYGGVNSGLALLEMGRMLIERGYVLLGAAKILAVHSYMWRSNDPLGAGHPGEEDDEAVCSLVAAVRDKLSSPAPSPLSLADLDYQPIERKEASLKKSVATAKQAFPPMAVDQERCTRCGACAALCPSGAITLTPWPEFGEDCFFCLKCVRECSEEAIPMDMSAAEARIRGMALAIDETPPSMIFL